MKNIFKKTSLTLIIAILLLGLPLAAGYVADALNSRTIDPDQTFWWISIHHIAQALFFIPLIFIAKKIYPKSNFGFHMGNHKKGFKYVLKFTLFFLIYTGFAFGFAFATNSFQSYNFPLTWRNALGYLGFQLLLSGPSEELLFRSFGITLVAVLIPGTLFKGKLTKANLILAVVFGLAHVGIYFSPFNLTYSPFQLIYAFVLGLIYGDCFEKTESIFYPMMLHSISNVIAVGTTILFMLL